jgi:hypothetical protein
VAPKERERRLEMQRVDRSHRRGHWPRPRPPWTRSEALVFFLAIVLSMLAVFLAVEMFLQYVEMFLR